MEKYKYKLFTQYKDKKSRVQLACTLVGTNQSEGGVWRYLLGARARVKITRSNDQFFCATKRAYKCKNNCYYTFHPKPIK